MGVRKKNGVSSQKAGQSVREKVQLIVAAKRGGKRPLNELRNVRPQLGHVVVPSSALGCDGEGDGSRKARAANLCSERDELQSEFVQLHGGYKGGEIRQMSSFELMVVDGSNVA